MPAEAPRRRKGGKPVYTPETAARRAAGRVQLGLTPERAATLRALGAGHPGGMAGLVSDWIDDAQKQKAPG